jgi:hypothetical protein
VDTTATFGRARVAPADQQSDPIVGIRDLPALGVAYHPNHLRRLWEGGHFPKPHHLSARKLVWRRSAVLAWVASKLEEV